MLIIYKSFIRPHLDHEYTYTVYEQPNNSSLSDKIVSLQYNVVSAMASAIRRSSKEIFYQKLSFESLDDKDKWENFASYINSYPPGVHPIFLIGYLPYKDLIEIRVPFSLYSAGQNFFKLFFIIYDKQVR